MSEPTPVHRLRSFDDSLHNMNTNPSLAPTAIGTMLRLVVDAVYDMDIRLKELEREAHPERW